ncbi:hypothetical protein HGRIS_010552 [Hohenbuehelia grisea]|uniref:C2H2-type domain-containing protein n=1 Tax=Hohenbuehelia grisea TaxID=104357 RepID=A0ABR3IXS8_9AGAR
MDTADSLNSERDRCEQCGQGFSTNLAFAEHMLFSHALISFKGLWVCPFVSCDHRFEDRNAAGIHVLQHLLGQNAHLDPPLTARIESEDQEGRTRSHPNAPDVGKASSSRSCHRPSPYPVRSTIANRHQGIVGAGCQDRSKLAGAMIDEPSRGGPSKDNDPSPAISPGHNDVPQVDQQSPRDVLVEDNDEDDDDDDDDDELDKLNLVYPDADDLELSTPLVRTEEEKENCEEDLPLAVVVHRRRQASHPRASHLPTADQHTYNRSGLKLLVPRPTTPPPSSTGLEPSLNRAPSEETSGRRAAVANLLPGLSSTAQHPPPRRCTLRLSRYPKYPKILIQVKINKYT